MNLSSSILCTLSYADVFRYPYTIDELISWMPKNRWTQTVIRRQLALLIKDKKIECRDSLYVLFGQSASISLRRTREVYAKEKWEKAKRAASLLHYIPTIELVGVTGGLSMMNADKNDDIDFFICTKKGTLWISRLLATLSMELFGIRRRPASRKLKDVICLNMYVDETALSVRPQDRDLFTAHEVLQMRVLWERPGCYRLFLQKNSWVRSWFPRVWKNRMQQTLECSVTTTASSAFFSRFLSLLEQPAKFLQMWYMHKRRTTEVVSDTVLRFHPRDARIWIRKTFEKKLQQRHLPLDRNFFRP